MVFEHAERDAEEDVESIKEQDIPYAEKRLINKTHIHIYNLNETERKGRYLNG